MSSARSSPVALHCMAPQRPHARLYDDRIGYGTKQPLPVRPTHGPLLRENFTAAPLHRFHATPLPKILCTHLTETVLRQSRTQYLPPCCETIFQATVKRPTPNSVDRLRSQVPGRLLHHT